MIEQPCLDSIRAEYWDISVSGYGSFIFYGTELEAEELRRHKAAWERGRATKKRIETHET